jgi:hypothetical protein
VARAAVPVDSCRVFGPFPPEPLPGEPPSRPADPDTTGGYYQPVRLLVPTSGGDAYSVGVTRLDCGIIGATQEQSAEYNKRHTPNANPEISSVALERANGANETLSVAPGSPSELSDGGADAVVTSLDAGGDGSLPDSGAAGATDAGTLPRIAVTPGEQVTFHAKWASCPAPCSNASCPSPTACSGSEAYVDLDLSAHRLVDRRESIRVSWFATDGTFDHDRTGRSEAEATTPNTDNAWTAPSAPADVHMWLVIRDDRGGVGFSTYVIHVGR